MTKQKALRAGVSVLLATVFGLFFYAFNTPLGPSIGSDNAMYLTMGTALANGYAPYTEIFDHKGPLLFALQWLPQAIGGGYSTLTVFIQQVLFLFACLMLIGAIADHFGAPSVLAQLIYLALIGGLVGGGNLTEEYANAFAFGGILLLLRTFKDGVPKETKGMFARAAFLGALTMVCFFIRANNALVLCAMTLAVAAYMLIVRRLDALARCAGGFAAGMAIAALPVTAWLACRSALAESVYGSIIHNMMYSKSESMDYLSALFTSRYGHTALLMAALSCGGALLLIRRSPVISIAMAAGAFAGCMAAFISQKFYDHYLILGAPLATAGACLLLERLSRLKKKPCMALMAAAALICCGFLGVKGMETNSWRLSEREGLDEFTQDAQALYALVPEGERDQFMAYRAEPKWYVAAKALPCMRFYFLQEILAQADPAVMDEIVTGFETDPPKWLVIYYNREFGPPYDERVAEIFASRYEFVDAKGQYQLLRLKDE